MAEQFLNTDTFLEQIRKGSTPMTKEDTTVVVDDKQPSAVGGLAALGATALGTALIAKRIPGARNFFKSPKPSSNVTYTPTKTVSDSAGDSLTATGQSQELILSPSKALVPMSTRSKFGEVQNIPFTQGKGYSQNNPIVGSATFDRIKEAQFDSAPAEEWIKWLGKANNPQLKVNSGPLTGVSRRVTADELDELNIIKLGKDGRPESGFLKIAMDEKMPVDRDTLLEMVNNSPINSLKTLRLGVRGNPTEDVLELTDEFKNVTLKQGLQDTGTTQSILNNLRAIATITKNQKNPIAADTLNMVQRDLRDLAGEASDPNAFANVLVKLNRITGDYNQYSKKVDLPEGFKFRKDKTGNDNFYPAYKDQTGYALQGGENYTEDVIYYAKRLPNVSGGKFTNRGGAHFVDNEIGFIRYDDLPNPKLGQNARHVRISELQTDLHSPQFDKNQKADYFKNKINPFNTNIQADILKKERTTLLEKLAPFRELGRGALTRSQEQEVAKLTYQLNQLDRQAVSQLTKPGANIYSTTAGPLSRSYADFAIKNILRDMAERRINAVSIVPSAMNKGVKMPNPGQIGDELNYGLMNGKAVRRTTSGAIKESSELAVNQKVLKKIAKQYGAKFEQFDMPKSNPNKEFKIIRTYRSTDNQEYGRMVRDGRATYDRKIGDVFEYDDHIAAARTEREADDLLAGILNSLNADRSNFKIVRMIPTNPDNYVKVPTLIADNQVLDKFLLPMKAYMRTGGLVDKTNIFKSLI